MNSTPAQQYNDVFGNKINFEYLRNKLKARNLEEEKRFSENFPRAKKVFSDNKITIKNLRAHSAKLLGAGILSGSFLLSTPLANKIPSRTARNIRLS